MIEITILGLTFLIMALITLIISVFTNDEFTDIIGAFAFISMVCFIVSFGVWIYNLLLGLIK